MGRKKEYDIDTVVECAMHSFWDNGYENTSVRTLAKDMGINQFSIYSTFGNKHDLFLHVMKAYKKFVKENFLKNIINSDGAIEDIRTFLMEYGLSIQSGEVANGCLMVNTSLEITSDANEIIKNELNIYFDFVKNVFFELFEKSKVNNELPTDFDSEKYASYILGSLQGLSVYAKLRSREEVINYIDLIMKTIL